MFRNAFIYHVPAATCSAIRAGDIELDAALPRVQPIDRSQTSTRGFAPPMGDSDGPLVHQVGACLRILHAGEDRRLPAAAVNAELEKRLAAIEAQTGRRPGGKARRQLKTEVIETMLPGIPPTPYRLAAYIDAERGLLVVDTASPRKAESLVSALRTALGSFPVTLMAPEQSPATVLTAWLRDDGRPEPLRLGTECELREINGAAVWRASKQELVTDEVETHIEAGKHCTRLALVTDTLQATIDATLTIRKLKLTAGDHAEAPAEDMQAELDGRFALLALEVGQLYDVIAPHFGIRRAA
jgi:recombination associated protein RdgC